MRGIGTKKKNTLYIIQYYSTFCLNDNRFHRNIVPDNVWNILTLVQYVIPQFVITYNLLSKSDFFRDLCGAEKLRQLCV